jgi:O-antigen/teichoic acid export membrane protein
MIKQLLKSPLFTLVSATTFAQVISFLLSIVLARIYGPSQFGALQIFLTVSSIIAVPSLLKFDVALVAAHDNNDAEELFRSAWFTLIAFVFFVVFVLCFLTFFTKVTIPNYWWLLPTSLFGIGLMQLSWMWFVRIGSFKKVYWVRILESISIALPAVFLSAYKEWGLIVSNTVGQIFTGILLLLIFLKEKPIKLFQFQKSRFEYVFKKFQIYPKINILQGFNDILQVSLPILLLSQNYNSEAAGYYAQCLRVLQLPARLIITPLSHVFFSNASKMYRQKQDLYPYVMITIKRIALSSLPFIVILFFIGPILFSIVFGEKWKEAGVYASILSPWILMDIIRAPIVQISNLFNKQGVVFRFSLLINLILTCVLIIPFFTNISSRSLIILLSSTQTVLILILIVLVVKMTRQNSENFIP